MFVHRSYFAMQLILAVASKVHYFEGSSVSLSVAVGCAVEAIGSDFLMQSLDAVQMLMGRSGCTGWSGWRGYSGESWTGQLYPERQCRQKGL